MREVILGRSCGKTDVADLRRSMSRRLKAAADNGSLINEDMGSPVRSRECLGLDQVNFPNVRSSRASDQA